MKQSILNCTKLNVSFHCFRNFTVFIIQLLLVSVDTMKCFGVIWILKKLTMNFWIFKTSKLLFGDVHTILFLTFFVLSCENYLGRKNYFDLFRTPDCLSAQHKGVFSTLLVKTYSILNSPVYVCKMSLIQLICSFRGKDSWTNRIWLVFPLTTSFVFWFLSLECVQSY